MVEKDQEPLQAKSISVGRCGCPSIHVMLQDPQGNVFAQATMSLETALRLSDDIVDQVRHALEDKGDHIGICEGHA